MDLLRSPNHHKTSHRVFKKCTPAYTRCRWVHDVVQAVNSANERASQISARTEALERVRHNKRNALCMNR